MNCYWCKVQLDFGALETRKERLRYFCCVSHIYRYFNTNSTKEEFNLVKIFIFGKYIDMLSRFYDYED